MNTKKICDILDAAVDLAKAVIEAAVNGEK